jgi:ankyrin repeat protein
MQRWLAALLVTHFPRPPPLRISVFQFHADRSDSGVISCFGAALCFAARRGHTDVVRVLLHADGVDVNTVTNDGNFPLYMATENNHLEIVRLILQTPGVDVNKATTEGATPLFIAAQSGHVEITQLLLRSEGLDVNAETTKDASALLVAAHQGHMQIVEMLVKAGADPSSSVDASGRTPLSFARDLGDERVVALLEARAGVGAGPTDAVETQFGSAKISVRSSETNGLGAFARRVFAAGDVLGTCAHAPPCKIRYIITI